MANVDDKTMFMRKNKINAHEIITISSGPLFASGKQNKMITEHGTVIQFKKGVCMFEFMLCET